MKVSLFINSKLDPAISMRDYASRLVENLRPMRGLEVDVISIKGRRLPILRDIFSKDLFYPLYAKFKEGQVNHITDHSYASLAYLLEHKRTVVTCHDLNPLEFRKQSSWLGRKRFLYNVRGMLKAGNIIAVSQSTKQIIQKHFCYKGNIHIIYHGLDTVFQRYRDRDEAKKTKEKFGLEGNIKYLMHVGTSYPCKNVESILRILRGLEGVKLIKAGQFTRKQLRLIQRFSLAQKITSFKNLKVESLVELYNAADALVFPSYCEGFGMPVLEAMACGCPVICSKTTSLPEIGGEAPVYIDPYSDAELKKAINRVLEDSNLKEEMAIKGLIQAKKFSWEKTAEETARIYQDISRSQC